MATGFRMITHNDIKTVAYLNQMIRYAGTHLGCRFKPAGEQKYSAYCPFHAETRDSFRVYVDKKDIVRFHCFGACRGDWDVYDLIMLREKCSFRQAQQVWADYLGVKIRFHDGKSPIIPEPDEEPEPDDTVEFLEPEEPDDEIKATLADAARFYNELLLSDGDGVGKIFKYLEQRAVGKKIIRLFRIGYAPPYADEKYSGRALINTFLPRFKKDYRTFQPFYKGCLVRLLNDESARGYGYYRQQIDFSRKDMFSRNYGDYFAGRIVFPIHNTDSQVIGCVGRRPDNRGTRWLKQQTEDTAITTKSWLYGIDKAHRFIKHYRTVILVEGIFDYFAFYNLLQDQDRPVVASTLGSYLSAEAMNIFKSLGVEHFIVAYDWDKTGRKGIERIASGVGGKVYYLGGMKPGQDPYDKLKGVSVAISGFSLKYLAASAKKHQSETDKPINMSFISCGPPGKRNVVFQPTDPEYDPNLFDEPDVTEYYYNVDDFMPLLSYNHGNKAMLDGTLIKITKLLEARPTKPQSDKVFTIPVKFLQTEAYTDLGPALILWLRLVIEQQSKKRKIKQPDRVLAQWLKTSRVTVVKYKRFLKKLGYLNITTKTRPQNLSVNYFPKS